MTPNTRHRVFLSFHHALDEWYKQRFEQLFHHYEKAIISHSVQDGDIDVFASTETIRKTIRDNNLRASSVTVVLVGQQTWKRKHVDWEIASSLCHTLQNRRSALIGLLLPSRPDFNQSAAHAGTIPARLVDNVRRGYASLHDWTEDATRMTTIIHNAWLRRFGAVEPEQSRAMLTYNVRDGLTSWE